MGELAQLLADPAALLNRAKAKAPEPIALRRASARIAGASMECKVQDLGAAQKRVADMVRAGDEGALSRRQLRLGCQTFFLPPYPPGRDPAISERLVSTVESLQRRAAFLALLDSYLDAFAVDDADVRRLGANLLRLASRWPWRDTDTWRSKAEAFALFDPDKAPIRIGSAVLASDQPIRLVLEEAGLNTEGRRKGKLAEAAFREGCRIVAHSNVTTAPPAQCCLIDWGEIRPGGFAFPDVWPDFAGALFEPWAKLEPPQAHKRLLVDSVLDYAGDPRIRRSQWREVEKERNAAYGVLVKWLTKVSVEQFFDIVSETMRDRPDMWAQRRQFWTRYLKKDLISKAWVAFGSAGAKRADQAASRTGDKGLTMFGRLASGANRTAEHAALIMEIGDLTVVEWSHNGSWNIWPRGATRIPVLFRHNEKHHPDYHPTELMGAPIRGPHNNGWQRTVADIIQRYTGLRP